MTRVSQAARLGAVALLVTIFAATPLAAQRERGPTGAAVTTETHREAVREFDLLRKKSDELAAASASRDRRVLARVPAMRAALSADIEKWARKYNVTIRRETVVHRVPRGEDPLRWGPVWNINEASGGVHCPQQKHGPGGMVCDLTGVEQVTTADGRTEIHCVYTCTTRPESGPGPAVMGQDPE